MLIDWVRLFNLIVLHLLLLLVNSILYLLLAAVTNILVGSILLIRLLVHEFLWKKKELMDD